MRHLLPYLFLITFLAGCDADVWQPYSSELVVEGWIEGEGFPVVMVTKTVPLSTDKQPKDSLANYLVKWATVSVSDGDTTVFLTGKYDKGYFPPYVYTTTAMRGKEGKSYHLRVEYRDYCATATTTVPAAPAVEGFYLERAEGKETYYIVNAILNDPEETKNYYQLFSRVGGKEKQFLTSYLGNFDDNVLKRPAVLPIYRGRKLGSNNIYTSYFLAGDTVAVKVAQIDAEAYRFWRGYNDILSNGSNQFFTPAQNVRGNVEGARGYWHGMGCRTAHFIIPYL